MMNYIKELKKVVNAIDKKERERATLQAKLKRYDADIAKLQKELRELLKTQNSDNNKINNIPII